MAAEATDISAATGLLCILGHPVSHSLSPRIHNAALRHQRLDMVYLAFDVEDGRLGDAFEALRLLGARGANLTIPHKEAALPLLDEVDPTAARIGAANTIVNEQGRLIGYNTDVSGFAAALRTVRSEGAQGSSLLGSRRRGGCSRGGGGTGRRGSRTRMGVQPHL